MITITGNKTAEQIVCENLEKQATEREATEAARRPAAEEAQGLSAQERQPPAGRSGGAGPG